jgi:hypothetical protein
VDGLKTLILTAISLNSLLQQLKHKEKYLEFTQVTTCGKEYLVVLTNVTSLQEYLYGTLIMTILPVLLTSRLSVVGKLLLPSNMQERQTCVEEV